MKKWIGSAICILAALAIWRLLTLPQKQAKQIPNQVKNFAGNALTSLISAQPKVSLPPPLRQMLGQGSPLTDAGVISLTNQNRQQNGDLPPLRENQTLDQEASAKLADMFKQQYFEHINPQGRGPADLAKTYGYAYVSIGENLALGNFNGDRDLLTAWMNSPGHRANILNSRYKQIGAAVGKGLYKGQSVWMAAQEFGEPASACPSVDTDLKSQIGSLRPQVDQMQAQLSGDKSQMDSQNPQSQSQYDAYNAEVANYNSLVAIYNNKVDQLKLITAQYDAEVSAYNACLKS